MKNFFLKIACFLIIICISQSLLSIHVNVTSDFTTYVKIINSLGGVSASDFVLPGSEFLGDAGLLAISKIQWLGSDKKVYEVQINLSGFPQRNWGRWITIRTDNTIFIGESSSGESAIGILKGAIIQQ